MFDHVSIGVRDIARSKTFYDVVLAGDRLRSLSACAEQFARDTAGGGRDVGSALAELSRPDDPKSGLHFLLRRARSATSVAWLSRRSPRRRRARQWEPGMREDYRPALFRGLRRRPRRLSARGRVRGERDAMATIRRRTPKPRAPASDVWSAIRDIGALHTRLVPRLVTDTKLEPGVRVVTFVNGMVMREPIVTLDDEARQARLDRRGGRAAPLQRLAAGLASAGGATGRVDRRLPARRRRRFLTRAIEAGTGAMKRSLDALAA